MRIGLWIALGLLMAVPIAMFLIQRWRAKRADREGVVVYATVVSLEPVKVFGKPTEMMKIVMWVQEPNSTTGREVSLRSRVAAGQEVGPGAKLCVVIDP